jgi:hypothetical protein
MPSYYSNHRTLVAVIYAEGGGELKRYRQWTQRFLLSLPCSPQMQLDTEYEELQWDIVCPPVRERPANSWVTTKMLIIINCCASLHGGEKLSQSTARRLSWQVKACLAADRLLRTKNTASNIKGCLAAGDLVEAWHYLKGWYCLAEDQAPKACLEMLARQTAKWVKLYTVVPPNGWLLPINSTPTPVPDGPPTDLEIWEVVVKLLNGCTVGAMGMKEEHLKGWLHNIKQGAGSCWRLLCPQYKQSGNVAPSQLR